MANNVLYAENGGERVYVNTIDYDISVKSVKVLQSANIIDDEINVRNAMVHNFVNTAKNVMYA
jgi:hypothetical protein